MGHLEALFNGRLASAGFTVGCIDLKDFFSLNDSDSTPYLLVCAACFTETMSIKRPSLTQPIKCTGLLSLAEALHDSRFCLFSSCFT